MTKSDIVFVDSDALEEQLFRQWIQRFDASLDVILKHEDTEETSSAQMLAAFSKKLLSCIESEQCEYPPWVDASKLEDIGTKVLPAKDELKCRIRQLMLPSALHHFHRLLSERNECITFHRDLSDATACNNFALQVEELFRHLDHCCHDDFVALCRLSETHQRLYLASDRDSRRVSAWLSREAQRFKESSALTEQLARRHEQLERKPGSLISVGLEKIKEVCDEREKALQQAVEAEEEARRILEEAKRRKQEALQGTLSIKNLYARIEKDSAQAREITAKKLEIEKFNAKSSKEREELILAYRSFMEKAQHEVLNKDLGKTIPTILRSLLQSFVSLMWPAEATAGSDIDLAQQSIFGPCNILSQEAKRNYSLNNIDVITRSTNEERQPLQDEMLICMARLGLETIRLWKQLNGSTYYKDVSTLLDQYEHFFASKTRDKVSYPLQHTNKTIVLYYEHYEHETPNGHFECNARYTEAMAMLRLQLNSTSSVEMDATKLLLRKRDMLMMNCDDVVAPPLWVLPLIHSTSYLMNLGNSSKEAQEADLYVPLEFHSEYEDDSDSSSDSESEEKSTPFQWDAAEDALGGLKEELEILLRPQKGDAAIHQLLYPTLKQQKTQTHHHRQRHSVSISESHGRRQRKNQPVQFVESAHVSTPMGSGVVLLPPRLTDKIIAIKLDFGAVGYFHTSCVSLRGSDPTSLSLPMKYALEAWRTAVPVNATEDYFHQASGIDRYVEDIVNVMISIVKKPRLVADLLGIPMNVFRTWLDDSTTPWVRDVILLKVKVALGKDSFDDIVARMQHSTIALRAEGGNALTEDGKLKFLARVWVFSIVHVLIDADGLHKTGVESNSIWTGNIISCDAHVMYNHQALTRKESIRQAKVSAWFCDRLEKRLLTRVRHYAYDWLQKNRSQLTADEKTMLDSLSEWIKGVPFLPKDDNVVRGRPPTIKSATLKPHQKLSSTPSITSSACVDLNLISAFKDYLALHHINQTQAAEMLAAEFPINANQNMVSQWTRRVAGNKVTVQLNNFIREWLQQRGCNVPTSAAPAEEAVKHSNPEINEEDTSVATSPIETNNSNSAIQENSIDSNASVSRNGSADSDEIMSVFEDEQHNFEESHAQDAQDMDIFSSSDSDIFSMDNEHDDMSLSLPADATLFDSDEEDAQKQSQFDPYVNVGEAPPSTLAASRSRRKTSKRSHSDYYYEDAGPIFAATTSDDDSVVATINAGNRIDLVSSQPSKRFKYDTTVNTTTDHNSLRIQVLNEMRRRKLSQSRAFEEAALDRDMHTFSRYLNNAFTSPTYEASLQIWLEKSKEHPSIGCIVPETVKACPLCGRSELDFSSIQVKVEVLQCRLTSRKEKPVPLSTPTATSTSSTNTSDMKSFYKGRAITIADPVRRNTHYSSCEQCKKQDVEPIARCAGCPCVYHYACIPLSSIPPEPWYCPKCIESGVDLATPLSCEDIPCLLQQRWILIYSQPLRRWRQGYVVDVDPDNGFYLCRWWRLDAKWGKCSYVDASAADVLWSPTLRGPTDTDPPKLCGVEGSRSVQNVPKERKLMEQGPRKVGRPRSRENYEKDTSDDNDITSDTYIGAESLRAALCTLGVGCRAVDLVINGENTNAFLCTRPPGHHAGRRGCTVNCLGTGFCLMNNAAAAVVYARVRWGIERVAVVDIDAHFGNGTAELLRGDPKSFFGCVHMVYGDRNLGFSGKDCCGKEWLENGFFPAALGCTEILDNYVSVGVYPEVSSSDDDTSFRGPSGFRRAFIDVLLPKLEKFDPQLLIISAGFDGFSSDPLGGELGLTTGDITWVTSRLVRSMNRPDGAGKGRIVSFLEGGYDTSKKTAGLATSVDAHVRALRTGIFSMQ